MHLGPGRGSFGERKHFRCSVDSRFDARNACSVRLYMLPRFCCWFLGLKRALLLLLNDRDIRQRHTHTRRPHAHQPGSTAVLSAWALARRSRIADLSPSSSCRVCDVVVLAVVGPIALRRNYRLCLVIYACWSVAMCSIFLFCAALSSAPSLPLLAAFRSFPFDALSCLIRFSPLFRRALPLLSAERTNNLKLW